MLSFCHSRLWVGNTIPDGQTEAPLVWYLQHCWLMTWAAYLPDRPSDEGILVGCWLEDDMGGQGMNLQSSYYFQSRMDCGSVGLYWQGVVCFDWCLLAIWWVVAVRSVLPRSTSPEPIIGFNRKYHWCLYRCVELLHCVPLNRAVIQLGGRNRWAYGLESWSHQERRILQANVPSNLSIPFQHCTWLVRIFSADGYQVDYNFSHFFKFQKHP